MAETAEMKATRLAALSAKIQDFYNNPWKLYHPPFHIAGSVWFIGNTYVSTYLIDTGSGLILIDPGFRETIYLVFDSIRKLGYDPADIKHIFLSHGHVDHVGGTRFLQEYSGAKVWLGKGDEMFFSIRRDLILDEDHVAPFTINEFYDYNKPFLMGNTKICFRHTPGHTPGTTSFFVHTLHNGKPVVGAMHGGLGLNGLTARELEENHLPVSLQSEFLRGLKSLQDEPVDFVLPSHMHNYDILSRYAVDDGSGDVFIDPDGWRGMMQAMLFKAEDVLPELFEKP